MKRCTKLLLAISLLFSVVLQIQAYPNLPLKNLFTVLKQDHIGFGHALLHSDWIENVYQYAEGGPHKNIASEGERQQYRADKENDHVANLVRTLWFRFRSENDLEPAQVPKDVFKPLDPKLFGIFINFVYQLAEKESIEKTIESMDEYGKIERQIKNIKLSWLAGDFRKCKKEMEQQFGGEKHGDLLQAYKKAEKLFREIKKKSGNEKKKIGANYKELIGQASGEERIKLNLQKADEMKKLDESVERAENAFVTALAGYVGDLSGQVGKDEACNKAFESLKTRRALVEKLKAIKKPGSKELKKLKKDISDIDGNEQKLKEGDLKELQFLLTAVRNALKTQSERYVPGTVEGILWAFFFHKINKECATVDEKIKAINTCLSQLDDKYKNEEFAGEVNLQDRYDKEDFDDFGAQLKDQNANVQIGKMLLNYDLSLQYLISMLAGKFPKAPSGGTFGFEYDTKDHKITDPRPNCFEKAMLDFFSVLWHNPETGTYDNTLFPESIVKDGQISDKADFKKLEEALKYFYLADEKIEGKKRVEEEAYTFEHKYLKGEKEHTIKWTSLAKLKEIMGQQYREKFEKLNIDEVPVSEIASGRMGQVFMNLVSDKEGIVYNKPNTYSTSDKNIFELYPGVKNFVKLVCYFYGIDEEKVKGEDGEFDVSKLGELLSTEQREITFKKIEQQDVPNKIEVSVRDYGNSFYFGMTVDIMTGHVELRLPAREASGFEIVQKELPGILLKLISRDLGRGIFREGVASLLTLQTSKELLKQNVVWNVALLNLVYYSLLMTDVSVRLIVISDILGKRGKYYNQFKAVLHNVIDSLPDNDNYLQCKVLTFVIESKRYTDDEKLRLFIEKRKVMDWMFPAIRVLSDEEALVITKFFGDKINIKSLSDEGDTILIDALRFGKYDLAKYIFENYESDFSVKPGLLLKLSIGKLDDLTKKIMEIPNLVLDEKDAGAVLLEAMREEKNDVVEWIIKNYKFDVNTNSFFGTLLTIAIWKGYKDVVKLIIQRGGENLKLDETVSLADVEFRGGTALIFAIEEGYKDIVELLLNYSDKIGLDKEVYGKTPLTCAIFKGYKDMVELLLQYPDKIGLDKLVRGETPLMYAIREGDKDIVELLLKYPDKIGLDKGGLSETPLTLAIQKGDKDIIALLLKYPDKIGLDKAAEKLFELAIKNRNLDVIKLLLKRAQIDVNKEFVGSYDKKTPLELAIGKGDKEIIKLLLKHSNIEVNKEFDSYDTKTPLGLAIEKGDKEIIKLLLKHSNIEVNKEFGSYDTKTPLGLAIEKGDKDIIKMFLEPAESGRAQIDVNKEFGSSYDKKTPLGLAIEKGDKDIIKMLLEPAESGRAQIDVNKEFGSSYDKKTPLGLAIEKGDKDIIKMLLQYPKIDVNKEFSSIYDEKTPLSLAMEKGDKDIITMLLEHPKINLNKKSMDSVFLHACKKGPLSSVQFLVEHGYIDLKDQALLTKALENVASVAVLKFLLGKNVTLSDELAHKLIMDNVTNVEFVAFIVDKKKINLNKQYRDGYLLLYALMQMHYFSGGLNPDVIKMLIEKGADVNIESGQPLFFVAENALLDAAKVIFEYGTPKVNTGGNRALIKVFEGWHNKLAEYRDRSIQIANMIINHPSINEDAERVDWRQVLENANRALESEHDEGRKGKIGKIIEFVKKKAELYSPIEGDLERLLKDVEKMLEK